MTRRKNPTVRLVGFGKPRTISPAVEAFLRNLFDASYPNPLGGFTPTERILSGIEVLVDVLPEHNGVHIDRLRALTRKQGEGTKAMRFLTDLADKHGVELYLYAKKVLGERDVAPDLALVRPENMPKYENPRASRRKVTR